MVNRGFLWGEQGGLKVLLSVLGDDLGRMPELKKSPNITDTPPFAIALPPFAIALPSQCLRLWALDYEFNHRHGDEEVAENHGFMRFLRCYHPLGG